jgi:hypothetical protein
LWRSHINREVNSDCLNKKNSLSRCMTIKQNLAK